MSNPTLEARYTEVRQRVAEAAARSGRSPESVYLVAVTKYAEPEDIWDLIELGHQDFGESRVQQLVQRATMLDERLARLRQRPKAARGGASAASAVAEAGLRWHMIGHLQKNKARKVVELCRLVHSVDSLRLAEELQQLAGKREGEIDVLVQVNILGEESKTGCPLPAAEALCDQIDSMIGVRVRGLMTMAPETDDPEQARSVFRRCRELFEEIAKTGVGEGAFNILSMGMSGDYEIAIEEGSNIVRVGSAIFGNTLREPETVNASEAPSG
ncbi:MAG: pyridoxal phosphate enzyme (YggS family) [Phycisphaerales bacterium]|jgi:pyridoxal phosphate enzyme (YggS family)